MTKTNLKPQRRFVSILVLLGSGLVMAAMFQNCGRGFSTSPQRDLATALAPGSNAISITPQAVSHIEFVSPEASSPHPETPFSYNLDPNTGEVRDMTDGNLVLTLSTEQNAELHSLLSDARVEDEGAKGASSDRVCTMVYRYPYARLHLQNQASFDLGGATSGCTGTDLFSSSGERVKLDLFLDEIAMAARPPED